MADLAMPLAAPQRSQGTRATTTSGPLAQVGGMAGLAPWLRGSDIPLAMPMRTDRPMLGAGQTGILAQQRALAHLPSSEVGQQAVLEQQKQLAQELRDQGSTELQQRHVSAAYQPSAEEIAATMITIPGQPIESEGGYTGATTGDTKYSPLDPYNYGPDYSAWYDTKYGQGALAAEGKRYAALDAAGQLGDYERLYGEFPEDPDEQEAWFRLANMGGTDTAREQDRIAQNRRTDLTEAGIMAALSMGMGAIAAPVGASMAADTAAEAAALAGSGAGSFSAYYAPYIGAASSVASGLQGGNPFTPEQFSALPVSYQQRLAAYAQQQQLAEQLRQSGYYGAYGVDSPGGA